MGQALKCLLGISLLLAGCSGTEISAPPATDAGGATQDVAVRSTPVVPGRPGRVFVMAGIGKNCEPIGEPSITVDQPPQKGDVSFVAGQETTIQYSLSGACTGVRTTGTGIYYTARQGATGTDRFSITARMGDGTEATRSFEVRIAE